MKRFFRVGASLPVLIVVSAMVLPSQSSPFGQSTATSRNPSIDATQEFQLTRRIIPRPAPLEFHGVRISLKPVPGQIAVKAKITNEGGNAVWLPGPIRWELALLDNTGNLIRTVRSLRRPPAAGSTVYKSIILKPGKSFSTKPFFVNTDTERRGTFYIFVQREVTAGRGKTSTLNSVTIRSKILRLTIRPGTLPAWRIVKRIPPSIPHAPVVQLSTNPPYPTHRIPTTGPIAALAEISKAVRAGNIQAVKQLCWHGSRQPPPVYVANAEEAIAMMKFCHAIGRQFGRPIGAKALRHLEQTHPSPKGFSRFVEELNLRSLRINGNRASVGTLWFNGRKFVPMPKFAFHFQKIRGHWLLDSRATYKEMLTARQYQLNVENSVKDTQIFDSLSQGLLEGRFATLAEFTATADRKMAAENDWFTSQSLHGKPRPVANSGNRVVPTGWAVSAHGVSITIAPGAGTNLVATLANNGSQMASCLNGGPFGWSLFVFGANGQGMGISQKQQARLRAAAQPAGRIPLAPGSSVRKTFNIARYCVLPAHGTFYVYASRFITVGGASAPIRSSILKVILRKGQPPRWRMASSLPSLKSH